MRLSIAALITVIVVFAVLARRRAKPLCQRLVLIRRRDIRQHVSCLRLRYERGCRRLPQEASPDRFISGAPDRPSPSSIVIRINLYPPESDIQSGNRCPLVSIAKGMIKSPITKAKAVVATGMPRLP
jgi:hypothetical protein